MIISNLDCTSYLHHVTIKTVLAESNYVTLVTTKTGETIRAAYKHDIQSALQIHEYFKEYYMQDIALKLKDRLSTGVFIETLLTPLLFKTKWYISYVYAKGSWHELETQEYSTRYEATIGHKQLCEKYAK